MHTHPPNSVSTPAYACHAQPPCCPKPRPTSAHPVAQPSPLPLVWLTPFSFFPYMAASCPPIGHLPLLHRLTVKAHQVVLCRLCFQVVTHQWFDPAILGLIILNMVLICMAYRFASLPCVCVLPLMPCLCALPLAPSPWRPALSLLLFRPYSAVLSCPVGCQPLPCSLARPCLPCPEPVATLTSHSVLPCQAHPELVPALPGPCSPALDCPVVDSYLACHMYKSDTFLYCAALFCNVHTHTFHCCTRHLFNIIWRLSMVMVRVQVL